MASTVAGNLATDGGGITDDTGSTLTVANSTFDANLATSSFGGAIEAIDGGYFTVVDSTFADNRSPLSDGGAVADVHVAAPSTGSLSDDTIVDNSANDGGGIYVDKSTLSVESSTIAANSSAIAGGGILTYEATVLTSDSIWANNSGAQCEGSLTSGGYNLSSDQTCGLDGIGDISNRNAVLGPLAYNGGPTETVAPLSTSPALGGGGNSCPTADQRATNIPVGALCDIGSVFVESTTTSLRAVVKTVRKGHETAEKYTVTVTPPRGVTKLGGSVRVVSGATTLCVSSLAAVAGSRTHQFRGVCSMSATKLPVGTHHVAATFTGQGISAASTSAAVTVKVTA